MYTRIQRYVQDYRNTLEHSIDNFASFTWDNVDAFKTYGAFIINNKEGSLKMYNGRGFTNEYVKPQFSSEGSYLTGVTFDNQKIEFEIGVYYSTAVEYRQFLNWLNPYTVGSLTFGFDKKWSYICKLNSLAPSTRYIIGHAAVADVLTVKRAKNGDLQGKL